MAIDGGKLVEHFCIGHKEKITLGEYWWKKTKIGKKIAYFCDKCEFCEGCQRVHPLGENGGGVFRGSPTKFWCYKWAKSSPPSPMKKAEGLSPAEVLSGVHLGYEPHFEGASQETYSEMKQKNREAVKDLK